jgi:thiosulfate reductase cytochrome b subunit
MTHIRTEKNFRMRRNTGTIRGGTRRAETASRSVSCLLWYPARMAVPAWVPNLRSGVAATTNTPRHTAMVRVTHWITTLCFFALLVSGFEIVISHPRFYWGEVGNVHTPALFRLPIPASRGSVQTGYGFVLPDQNGWSRYLHFQSAWVVVLAGLFYVIAGLLTGHFRKHVFPGAADLSWPVLSKAIADHLRFLRPGEAEDWSYNVLQRLATCSSSSFCSP